MSTFWKQQLRDKREEKQSRRQERNWTISGKKMNRAVKWEAKAEKPQGTSKGNHVLHMINRQCRLI